MEQSKIDLKTYGFVKNLVIKKGFRKSVKFIRVIHKIPKDGFDSETFDKFILEEKTPRIPTKINKVSFLADIKNLLKYYNLSSDWLNFFSDYVLFNWFGEYSDIRQIITLDLGTKTENRDEIKRTLEMSSFFDLNPVALLLPPSISERELEDYLKKNFRTIKKIQKKYINNAFKISELKQSKDKNRERDLFIYRKRDIPKKELMTELSKKFGKTLDYTYINKIIKKEKRRKSAGI